MRGEKKLQSYAAVAVSVAMSAGLAGAGARAQEQTQTELPPVQVTAQAKKAAAKKRKAAPAAAAQPSPAVEAEPVASTEAAEETRGNLSSDGGVDGYRATRTSTATKTDTPLKDIPQSITVVPKELAKDQGSRDMRTALSYVPGIVVGQGEGHRDAPTIRGVSTTADFFVDGVRDDVQYFRDLYNVDRIEVLKGPNAMIFGRGGGGGVINRVTKKAEGERIYEATTTYGSFDTKRVEVDAGQAISNDFAFRILGMYEDSGSYRDFVDLERYGINPKIMFRPDDNTKVHLAYEYFRDDRTVDRGIPSDSRTGKPAKTDDSTFFGNPDDSYMYFKSHVATATIEHKFDNGVQVKNHTQYGDYEKFYQNVYANSALGNAGTITLGAYNSLMERESIFNQTDVSAKVDMGSGIRHTLLAGVELGHQQTDTLRDPVSGNYGLADGWNPVVPFDDPVTFTSPPWGTKEGPLNRTELTLAGVYLQDQLEIGRYFEVIGGIRFDRFDLDFSNSDGAAEARVDEVWSPRVGVVFKPLEQLSLYASYSKSFLPFSGEQFSTLSAANADMRPEEFLNREIGFKWDVAPRLSFTGALFMLDRENQLVAIGGGESAQIGKTRTEGGELTLTGYVTDNWEVVAGYGYQVAEVLEGGRTVSSTTGNEVALVPRHTFSLWNKYHFMPNWAAAVGVVSRSDMYASIDNTVTLPGFARLDAALFWDINENLAAQLNVENVLDTEYYSTAHNNNNITPGSPRAYFLTVTSRF
ncbi:TonB-dependent siderophore receptor [Hyphomicrobium sp. CS1GBMeth3]|uniref:TonB-dependent receptor n=1 Tax=Hyphomicrobium sp. CS1GBMeth3 TaxID=1892845 RepID=UPI0009303CF8|nr:TonB-dependent siderophore receptor [Hyphomicrobium sp. CS1GBMeth3]